MRVPYPITLVYLILALLLAACGTDETPAAFQATLPGTANLAPVYTETATPSPTPTNTVTPSPTPTYTPTLTNTPSVTPTPSLTPMPTLTPTLTPSPTPTQPLWTLTPPSADGAPAPASVGAAGFSADEGWSCGRFPCEDDIAGMLAKIQVPPGFAVEHAGRFIGQPQQAVIGPDGRLYATVLLDGTRLGGVAALDFATGGSALTVEGLVSPVGLAFQPGTDVLYISGRETPTSGGVIYRVDGDSATPQAVINTLPCCWRAIDNQVNGLVFGPDGALYVGVSSLTDHAEAPNPESQPFVDVGPNEAAILRVQPHTGAISVFASGIRHPFDLTFDSRGQFYATDSGVLSGPGDRLLAVNAGAHYGFPYWRTLGCAECPPTDPTIDIAPALLSFPPYTLPRGLTVYTGAQFPANLFDNVFVALYHDNGFGQRVVRVNPADVPTDPEARAAYTPPPFVTGLLRPIDVLVGGDGALLVVDAVYGDVWRVRYTG